MARSHEYVDAPDEAQVAQLAGRLSPPVRGAYLAVHRLVRATLPDIRFEVNLDNLQIRYGNRQYGYNGWGLGSLSPASKWVGLYFMAGVRLADPTGIFEGAGAGMRHVKLRNAEQVAERAGALEVLLRQAAELHG
jgi:hypothetical protein